LRQRVTNKIFEIDFVPTGDQVADVFAKNSFSASAIKLSLKVMIEGALKRCV
jgi:hypothetical protein